MPTYRYRCSDCGSELEVWQSITDAALETHDGCGGSLVKVLSPAGIVLKGAGFYKTDSRSNGGPGRSKGKDREAAESGTKEPGTKDGATKDSGSKDTGAKDAGASTSGSDGGSTSSSTTTKSTAGS